jgi:hypothetical protein
MSKNNILLSNDDGKILLSNTASFSYDDETAYIGINNISASNITLSGSENSLLFSKNGIIGGIQASPSSNQYVVSSGTDWTLQQSVSLPIGVAGGDLSGFLPNPTVKSLSNVKTGSLPIRYGGLSGSGQTNILSSIPNNSIIIADSTGSLAAFVTGSGLDYTKNLLLGSNSGNGAWGVVDASSVVLDIDVQYFTCSVAGQTSIQTWTKKKPNHKFARVIAQAGGGGGGGSATIGGNSASGGGGGGYTDITVYVANISSANVTVGAGGSGVDVNTIASSGISSSFSATNIFISANGGTGGINGNAAGSGGNSGTGFTVDGGAGGDAIGATSTAGFNSGGASGGGSGVITSIAGKNGGIAGQYSVNTAGGVGVISGNGGDGSYTQNLFGYSIPIGFGSGGAGGSLDCNGGNGVFGGGGGGAGRITALPANRGGNGGDGFVVVVTY